MRRFIRAIAAFTVTMLVFMMLAQQPGLLIDPGTVRVAGFLLGAFWAFAEVTP